MREGKSPAASSQPHTFVLESSGHIEYPAVPVNLQLLGIRRAPLRDIAMCIKLPASQQGMPT